MPVQLNIGLNRKVGEPNFGSRGASVNLEVELDSAIVDDSDRLRSQIHKLFDLARQSLDVELHRSDAHRHGAVPGRDTNSHDGNGHHTNGHHVNGHHVNGQPGNALDRSSGNGGNGSAHGANGRHHSSDRPATQSQIRAVHAIAGRCRIDLIPLLQRFGVRDVHDLSLSDASSLIDELQAAAASHNGGDR